MYTNTSPPNIEALTCKPENVDPEQPTPPPRISRTGRRKSSSRTRTHLLGHVLHVDHGLRRRAQRNLSDPPVAVGVLADMDTYGYSKRQGGRVRREACSPPLINDSKSGARTQKNMGRNDSNHAAQLRWTFRHTRTSYVRTHDMGLHRKQLQRAWKYLLFVRMLRRMYKPFLPGLRGRGPSVRAAEMWAHSSLKRHMSWPDVRYVHTTYFDWRCWHALCFKAQAFVLLCERVTRKSGDSSSVFGTRNIL